LKLSTATVKLSVFKFGDSKTAARLNLATLT